MAHNNGTNWHVLLVEDDASTRRFLTAIVEKLGYHVTACESAEAGWDAYREGLQPLVLLDWMLPGMSGVDLCRQIRAMPQSDGTFILMSTSETELSDVEIALKAGADDYLVKPADITQIKIRLFIARQRLRAVNDRKQVLTALQNKLRVSENRKPEPTTPTTCLLQPWPGIVIVPIATAADNPTMESIGDQLLKKAAKSRARRVIIDLSQTAGFAPEVAQTLMKTIQTLKLVGARTILAGAAPGVARALVETGGDLTHVQGCSTLAEAFQHALNHLHLRVMRNSA